MWCGFCRRRKGLMNPVEITLDHSTKYTITYSFHGATPLQKELRIKGRLARMNDKNVTHHSGDITLRMATYDDVAALADLEKRAFRPDLYDSLNTPRTLRYLIGKANALLIVAELGGRVAGYAQITFKSNSDKARFYSLAVDPDFQGAGVGTALFSAVETVCRTAGARTLLLEIREDNDTLRNRYAKLGYAPYRTVADYYVDGAAAIKMQRAL